MLGRRAILAAGLGLAAACLTHNARAAAPHLGALDEWFWAVVRRAEARPPVGGPSAGQLDNSVFGVEAHRAGRINPAETPPVLAEFYVRAVLEPDSTERSD